MIIVIIITLSVYALANIYVARRVFQWLCLRFSPNEIVFAIIYIFMVLITLVMGYVPLSYGINRLMQLIGSYWMAITMYLLIFFLAADSIFFLGKTTKIIPFPIFPNARFFNGLAIFLFVAGMLFFASLNARKIDLVSYQIQLRDAVFNNMKIVLISDSHLGSVNNFENDLESIVQKINNLTPDIVCLAGDIFNDDFSAIRNPERAMSLLKSIDATFGVYACLGNHDGGRTFNQMVGFLEASNIKLLNDDYVIIDERLALFGRIDSSPIGGFGELKRQDISHIISSVSVSMPIIVLDHTPSNMKEYGEEVDLILSGHTHGGQVFPANINLLRNAMFGVGYGYYQRDANSPQVIVTSGISTWGPPMRLGTSNEIVSIILR